MKKSSLFLVLSLVVAPLFGQVKNTWDIFAKTKFESKFDDKIGEYIFYPNFPADLKAMEGKELTVEGYYVPFAPEDGNYIIISKFPMSQCFFCGGGGPESIAEVNFALETPNFSIDDLITVKGKLRLNVEDPDHINFILENAILISK
jgi:hypothetical protein